MRKLRLSRFIFVTILVGLALVSSLIFFLSRNREERYKLSSPVNSVVYSVSEFFSYPVVATKSFLTDLFQIDDLRAENSELKEQLTSLDNVEQRLNDLKEENRLLRHSLDFKASYPDLKVLTARVLSRSTVSWLDTIMIDLGTADDVSEGMLVVSEGKLIGKVNQSFASSSSVDLLTNTGISINIPVKILVESNEFFGIITGYDIEKKAFLVTKLNAKGTILSGSQVLTSGLDGKSPSNISVGRVSEVKTSDGLNQIVYVTSDLNFSKLSLVNVVGE